MIVYLVVAFVLLGLIAGSFLNFFVLRFGTGRMFDKRSQCFSCGHELSFLELVPVLSFLFLKGRCSNCQSKISWQYPLVELLSAILFGLIVWQFYGDWLTTIIFLVGAFISLAIGVYDWRHKIIPDGMVIGLFLLAIVYLVFVGQNFWADVLVALVVALCFFLLWYFSSGRLIGFGDVKLVLPLGLIVGADLMYHFVLISFVSGAVVGLGLILVNKFLLRRGERSFTMKSELPFAPFLIFGFWLSILSNVFLDLFIF